MYSDMKSFYVALTLTLVFIIKVETCEVGVSPPWKRVTYVPQDSTVHINCTANSSIHNPVWSMLLSGTTAISQFSFPPSISLLNRRGFYEVMLPEVPGTLKIIQLLINITQGNNGTRIMCNDVVSSTLFSETNLIIVEPSPVFIDANDLRVQTLNILWGSFSQSMYTLTITNIHNQPQILKLNQSYYGFTAPEGAPPCEIYNFSVTATYVGASYTGAGCSVPSPVLSRMLPSLPNITKLESSLGNYSLEKDSTGVITLTVFMSDEYYCEDYPVLNYTLVITNDSFEVQSDFFMVENLTISDILSDNSMYKFQVIARNTVGAVSSCNQIIYTTDIQMVRATVLSNLSNTFRILCDFISGSDALGCLVILVGKYDNTTVTLLRNSTNSEVNVTESVSCYKGVLGFDIEGDGQIGNLAVPGRLFLDIYSNTKCLPQSRPAGQKILFGLLGLLAALLIMIIAVFIIIIVFVINRWRSSCGGRPTQTALPSALLREMNGSQEIPLQVQPLYDLPNNVITKKKNSGKPTLVESNCDYSRTMHLIPGLTGLDTVDGDSATYAHLQDKLEEHHYHVLEYQKATQSGGEILPDPDVPPPFKPENSLIEPPHIYQEIAELFRDQK